MTAVLETPEAPTVQMTFLALDITRACQAQCTTCYNESSPQGTHGVMTREDWLRVVDQAAAAGVRQVQFIGGEPTLHPDLAGLVNRAVHHGLGVEVFSNLIHIRDALWPVLRQRGVTLATSYYSDQAAEHEAITRHRGSYAKTKANIVRSVAYRIPVRAGIVQVRDDQRVAQAEAELYALGVGQVRFDRVRAIGRGAGPRADTHQLTELCGHCARGRAAVMPNGEVAGCVMSGAMATAGNVRTSSLADILSSRQWQQLEALLPRTQASGCVPDSCTPREDSCQPSPGVDRAAGVPAVSGCNPNSDGSDCAPAETPACSPAY